MILAGLAIPAGFRHRAAMYPARTPTIGRVCRRALGACLAAAALARAGATGDWGQPSNARYVLESYGPDEGFTKAAVEAALQTRDGYVWIGTGSGLVRFDGIRYVSFRVSNTPAMASNFVDCLREDRAGNLWIGTERGLVRYSGGKFQAVEPAEVPIRALAEGPDGTLWIGTGTRGLYRRRGGVTSEANPPGGLPSASITAVLPDSSGRLWVGFADRRGIARNDGDGFRLHAGGDAPDDDVDSFAEWPAGTIWIGTHHMGLYRWRAGALTRCGASPALPADAHITDLQPARGGGMWIAAGDVRWMANPESAVMEAAAGLPEHDVLRLCGDSEGGLWICAKEGGLFRAPRKRFLLLSRATGLPGSRIRIAAVDPAGNLWMTVDQTGVTEVTADGRLIDRGPASGFPAERPNALYPDSKGGIWMGFSGGLVRWRAGRTASIGHVVDVQGLYQDRSGAMWVGCSQGLYRYEGGRLAPVPTEAGGPFLYATSFAEAPDGTVFVGCWRHGLLEYRDGRTRSFDHRNGLPSDYVRALCLDRRNRLWAGFGNWGLAVRIGGRWWNSTALSELLVDHVSAILEDDFGRMWFGTPAGIFFAPADELVAGIQGRGPLPPLRAAAIGGGDGRPAIWSGAQPTAWKCADGRLLFATHMGVVVVDPADFPEEAPAPAVLIESAAIDQRSAATGGPLRVPAGYRRIAIRYSAPDFDDPHAIRYQYKMDGYETGWVDGGAAREADYSALPPGRFTFAVRAGRGDGTWGPASALPLSVAPLFWQRDWVRLAGLVAFTGLVVGLVRYVSFRRLRRRLIEAEHRAALEKERARIARDIHDDIGNRMTEIILLSRLASGRNGGEPARDERLSRIGSSAREVTDALDEIVWAISPRRDTLRHLVAYLGEFAVEFLRTGGVACHLEVPDEIPNRAVTSETRHNVFLAVKEALNNVVRHAGAKDAWLRVSLGADRAVISVKDNGRGIPESARREGADGLQNMSQRMEEIKGRFALASRPGGGTEVSFDFPFFQNP